MAGYEYIFNEETREYEAIRRATGEVTPAVVQILPVGTRCYTPENQECYQRIKEKKQKSKLRRLKNNERGKFFFTPISESFNGLAPETVTRLIYLNTFIGYDNKLKLTERTPMKYKDIQNVLKTSKSTTLRFWKEVAPKYLSTDSEGNVISNCKIFKKGVIKNGEKVVSCQRLYIEGIRRLYEAVELCNHRQLGFFFKLLPFINIEYNLICLNPHETDLEKIELISMEGFCELIGYGITHISKLVNIYSGIRFNVGGRMEKFCAITYNGVDNRNAKIFINPRILYCGSDYTKVEVLGAFCR